MPTKAKKVMVEVKPMMFRARINTRSRDGWVRIEALTLDGPVAGSMCVLERDLPRGLQHADEVIVTVQRASSSRR